MNKLALTVWTGMSVRNLLFSPVLNYLTDKFEVEIISPYGEQLQTLFPDDNKSLSYTHFANPRWNLPALRGKLCSLLYDWNYYALWRLHRPKVIGMHIIRRRAENGILRHWLNQLGAALVILLRHPDKYDLLRTLAYSVPVGEKYKHIDIFLVSTIDVFKDQQLIFSCSKAQMPVVAIVHGWDNLANKGLLAAIPNRLIVWNEIMAEHAIRFHSVPRDQIDIVGVPQFEIYRHLALETNRRQFTRRFNISEETIVITYTATDEQILPDEPDLVDKLIAEIETGTFGPTILVLRLLPTSQRAAYYKEAYQTTTRPIRLDIPDSHFANLNTGDIGRNTSIRQFVELMQYSNIVINLASTVTLDALIFDTPVICPKFNISLPTTAWNAAHHWYESDHFKPLISTGAIYLPESLGELFLAIKDALRNPREKSKQRCNLVEQFCPELPTGQLILNAIENVISEKKYSTTN